MMISSGLLSRLERSPRILAIAKLANVGITMIWGFAVTYVFVRALPLSEFQAFLLLVAFGNFTVSAEFGLTSIIYSRLRRYWLRSAGDPDDVDFQKEEIGFLFFLLVAMVVVAGLLLGGAMLAGWVATGLPLLFFIYFLSSCINLPLLLVKRGLMATDHNLFWELLDLVRRGLTLILLLAVLVGFNLTLSVTLQFLLAMVGIGIAGVRLHRRVGMKKRHWVAIRRGGSHVKARYLRDIGSTMSLTISEMMAYNAPYFTIAMATHDPRPMLLFDFTFKMTRALTMVCRALMEAAMPGLTAAYYAHARDRFAKLLFRALGVGAAAAAGAGIALGILGRFIVEHLFNGEIEIAYTEIGLIILLMLTLSTICVSVFLQGSLGRFSVVLRQSIPFLIGSLLSVPVAVVVAPLVGLSFSFAFLAIYTMVFVGTAALHGISLARLLHGMKSAA
jgi:O-antigen/teichoic acid export membrane protein